MNVGQRETRTIDRDEAFRKQIAHPRCRSSEAQHVIVLWCANVADGRLKIDVT